MKVMTCRAIALSLAAATTQMTHAEEENISSQAASNGFVEDADFTLQNRNLAFYRNLNHGSSNQNYRNEWAHGFMTTFTSGFTQGVVGFGVDAFGNVGLKLNSGAGVGGTGLLPLDNSQPKKGQDEYSIAGGAVKARISETVLAFGQQRPKSPVFATGDSRLLPSYATGTSIISKEISDLTLQGGHFYSGNNFASTNQDGELASTYGKTDFRTAEYVGSDYAFKDNLSFGLHAAQFEDLWNQYYADLYHTLRLNQEMSLRTSLNYYNTKDNSQSLAGDINNNTYSGSFALTMGAHTFTLAHQRVNGDTPFDYVAFDGSKGDSKRVANAVQYSDFNNPGEKSEQIRYDLNMKTFGISGLSFMARYITGSDSDGTKADPNGAYKDWGGKNGKEWERNFEAKYVIQDGPAKDLSVRIRQATWRSNEAYYNTAGQSTGIDEVRIITEYPLDIL